MFRILRCIVPRSLRRIALLAAALACGLFIGEFALRLLAIDFPARDIGVVPHPLWHHWHRPEYAFTYRVAAEAISQEIHFNEHGMRDSRTIPLAKPFGALRVVVLGDSFVEALQVAEHEGICANLERSLREQLGRPVEVLNFGCSGFSSVTEYCLLSKGAGQFAPDAVICLHHFSDMTEDWQLPKPPWEGGGPSSWKLLAQRSQLCRVASGVADRCRRHRPPPDGASLKSSFDAVLRDPCNADDQEAWDFSLGHVAEMASWCGERNLPFLLVVIPIGTQIERVSAEFAEGVGFQYLAHGKLLENCNYQRRVTAYCQERGIEYLDLLPLFRAANPNGQPCYYLPRDQHWTAAGHALAARHIMSYIVQQWTGRLRDEPRDIVTP